MIDAAGSPCPRCGSISHWTAEIVCPPIVPGGDGESVFYFQCPRCSHIWVPAAPAALWPPQDRKEAP